MPRRHNERNGGLRPKSAGNRQEKLDELFQKLRHEWERQVWKKRQLEATS